MTSKVASTPSDLDQAHCDLWRDSGFMLHDLGLDITGRVAEIEGTESLLGRLLKILQNDLVAGVV